ncbi:MAG: DHA2 family efflux MFS transporter permease subunit [Chloroflexi bacterium]|nr:DHA2 family efflux MFS transporter permease subunit [Chloroflexota bacterium]
MSNRTLAPQRAGAQNWGAQTDETPHFSGGKVAAIMVSVMLGILLAALDQTVVGPAMPKIIGDLNGFEHYTWVFTIYLLTSTVSVPIFGKLSDMYGRKWFYVAGITVFLLGSVLSGLSADILQLIAFRGLQGLGAGIITANAFAIIADIIPPANRGKWQGAFGAIFGLSSVIGPTIGGYLTDNVGWRWVFYVNVPIGLIALLVLITTFPAGTTHTAKKIIDWWGAATLVAGLTPLLLALSLGGTPGWDWGSTNIIALFVVAAVFIAAFIFVETRAKEPILPLDLFKERIFSVSVITVFLTGVGLFGAVLYIPLFIQAIQGDSATSSGNTITPMTIAIVISSIVTGQVISRTGKYRIVGVIGMGLVTIGMFLLYTMNMGTQRYITIAYMLVLGLGLGVAFPMYTLVVQNAFPIQRVGVVTAAVQFFRNMGSTVGVAVLGTIVNNQFRDSFGPGLAKGFTELQKTLPPAAASQLSVQSFAAGLSTLNPQVLVGSENMAALQTRLVNTYHVPAAFAPKIIDVITGAMRPALFSGIQEAFLIATVLLGMGFITTIFLKEIPLRKSNQRAGLSAMAEGGAEGLEGESVQAGRELAAAGVAGTQLAPEEEPELV